MSLTNPRLSEYFSQDNAMLRTSASENVYPAIPLSLTFRSVSVKGTAMSAGLREITPEVNPSIYSIVLVVVGRIDWAPRVEEDFLLDRRLNTLERTRAPPEIEELVEIVVSICVGVGIQPIVRYRA